MPSREDDQIHLYHGYSWWGVWIANGLFAGWQTARKAPEWTWVHLEQICTWIVDLQMASHPAFGVKYICEEQVFHLNKVLEKHYKI